MLRATNAAMDQNQESLQQQLGGIIQYLMEENNNLKQKKTKTVIIKP